MLQTKRWALMLAGCTVALGAALIWLFELRFESGEFYPPYSSLRADPLGCRALYESLRELDHLHVRRNLSQQLSLPQPRGQTLCRFGVEPSRLWVQPLQAQALDSFVRAGGRLVVTFSPSVWATQTTIGTNPRRRAEAKPARRLAINLAEKWGLDLSHAPLPEGAGPVSASVHQAVHDLPSSVSWYSTLVFTNLDAAWKTIYQRDQHPVLIERTLGNGTIVLATDSYFVSNEALLRERHPTLLAWVIGVANAVCFDETHHGIAERPGIATLLRKYRLHGPVAVLLCFAVLYVWRRAAPFLPPANGAVKSATAVSGPEASAGFTALLRRSIRPEQLLDVCLDEWAKSFARRPRYRGEQMKLARQLLKQTDPVAAYGAIQRLLVQTHGRSENSLEKPCFAEAGLIAATTPAVSERN